MKWTVAAPPAKRSCSDPLLKQRNTPKLNSGTRRGSYSADIDSGRYRGEICAETEHHVLQKISPKSVIAHPKSLIADVLSPGQTVAINYKNGLADTKPFKARERAQSLAR